jgi:hypothetical protein
MARLLSGSTLRTGGSGEFIDLKGAQPQLPPTSPAGTGFTLITDELLRTSYSSVLGFIDITTATMRSLLPDQQIRVVSTGSLVLSTSTTTGVLAVRGGIGIDGNIFATKDITVNGITIGQGYRNDVDSAWNNLVIRGVASTSESPNDFSNGQQNISIGYDSLTNLDTAYKSIAIGRYALNTGTGLRNSIAIGDSSLKNIGILPTEYIKPIVNITTSSSTPITGITNANPAVVTSVDHGLSTGQRISIASVVGLSTGTTSLLNGHSYWVDVYTTDTFGLYTDPVFTTATSVNSISLGDITWTSYQSSGTVVHPIEVTVSNHGYTTGTAVLMSGIVGVEDLRDPEYTVSLNDIVYYINVVDTSTIQLYTDPIVGAGVDGTYFSSYQSGGTIHRVLKQDDNIAIGSNAGKSLIDGERNFFLGDNIATNLTTGSYNFFIGHDAGNGMKIGSGNVSIMGDNLIDGRDNQVAIGAIFYYDGAGYLRLTADTAVGLGSTAAGGNTGGLAVFGGVSVSDNIVVANSVTAGTTSTATVVSALYSNNVVLASYTSPALTSTDTVIVDEFAMAQYRTAKYTAQVVQGPDVHVTEITVFHDSTEVYIGEYGIVYTTSELGVFDAVVNGTNINLTFSPYSESTTTVKVVRMGLTS